MFRGVAASANIEDIMDYIDSTDNDDGQDSSRHHTGYKYFYTYRNKSLSRKIRASSTRKPPKKETQDTVGWLGTIAERSFEDADDDPRMIERPKVPVFGGHDSDDEDEDGDSELSQLSDSDDESISSRELWVEDVPRIDDAEFEALLRSSLQFVDAEITSSDATPYTVAENNRGIVDEGYGEGSSISVPSEVDSESDSDEDDRICRILHRGTSQVVVGNVPCDEDMDSSFWISVYESLLQELGYTPGDFRAGLQSNDELFMGYEAPFNLKLGRSKYSSGTAAVSGLARAKRTGLTSRTLRPSTERLQAKQSNAAPRSRSKSRERGIAGAKREPLRVRLLSGSILNRAIEWSLELPPSALPLLSTLDHHHESSGAQGPVLGARNEKERASMAPSGRNNYLHGTRERTSSDSTACLRPTLPLGTLMMLNNHRLGGCELRAMESVYEVERL